MSIKHCRSCKWGGQCDRYYIPPCCQCLLWLLARPFFLVVQLVWRSSNMDQDSRRNGLLIGPRDRYARQDDSMQ